MEITSTLPRGCSSRFKFGLGRVGVCTCFVCRRGRWLKSIINLQLFKLSSLQLTTGPQAQRLTFTMQLSASSPHLTHKRRARTHLQKSFANRSWGRICERRDTSIIAHDQLRLFIVPRRRLRFRHLSCSLCLPTVPLARLIWPFSSQSCNNSPLDFALYPGSRCAVTSGQSTSRRWRRMPHYHSGIQLDFIEKRLM